MPTFLFLLLALAFIWLIVRLRETRDELGALRALLQRLDLELRDLKRRTEEKPSSTAQTVQTETATASTAAVIPRRALLPETEKPIVAPSAITPPPLPTGLAQPPPVLQGATFRPAEPSPTPSSEASPPAPPILT